MNAKQIAASREAAVAKYRAVLAKHAELTAAAGARDPKLAYDLLVKVGEGAYGEVYKARHRERNELVALKVIRVNNSVQADNGLSLDLIREIKFLTQLSKYPNFVTLLETFFSQGDIYMVFEYMEADLTGLLAAPIQLSVAHVKCLMEQLLEALAVLHSKNVMHRDVKASNLLINQDGKVKLADFGLATNYKTRERFGCNVVTLWYRSPELLLGDGNYGPAVDVWSAGCIMAELALREALFRGRDEDDQLRLIFSTCGVPDESQWPGVTQLPNWHAEWRPSMGSGLAPRLRGTLPPDGLHLLSKLLNYDPKHRPTAREALADHYFQSQPKCQPNQLPTYTPLHEYEVRKNRARQREEQKRSATNREAAEAAEAGRASVQASMKMMEALSSKRAKK